MVKVIPNENKELYQCEECSFHYTEKEWAEKCEAWCREHKSCNIEIVAHAEENGAPRASPWYHSLYDQACWLARGAESRPRRPIHPRLKSWSSGAVIKAMMPKYDLDKIKFATDGPTFEKAVKLYESGKVTQFEEGIGGYSAIVRGTKPYRVSVEARRYDYGHCECYLGQNDTLCKHMVAVAIRAVTGGKQLSDEDKRQVSQVTCSGQLGELSKGELSAIKKSITGAVRYVKSYNGPSRTWFAYQNSLQEGCNRLSKIVSELPVSEQTTKLLVDTLLRLDDKLCRSGVDDSDGTVGGFIEETVQALKEYAKLDPSCVKAFHELKGRETCFGWEEPLLKLVK